MVYGLYYLWYRYFIYIRKKLNLPFDFQRRFMMGLQIPIIIMGFICFIETIKNKNKYFKTAMISILISLSIPSSIIVFNSRAQNKSWNIDKDL